MSADATGAGQGTASFAEAEALQERRWLGILYGPIRCLGIFHVPELSLLLHMPDLCPGILCDLRLGILYRLYALDLRPRIFLLYRLYALDLWPCIFLGRPGLELIQQD